MRRLFKVGADRHDVGRVTFSWHPDGNFLASAGKNGIVQITDRHGDIVDEIAMTTQAAVLILAWDKDGEYLAILQDGNGVVPLWSLSSRRVVPLETNLKDPTFLAWSKTGPQLAIGTAKGNLLIYNKTKKVKVPIVGKHAKKIVAGDWSEDGKLVLGSEDRTLTISNDNGDTLLHTEVKHAPSEVHFTSSLSTGQKNASEPTLSANLDGKSILLFDLNDDKEDPIELTFGGSNSGAGCKYGDIKAHTWFEDGLIMVGFSGGHLLVISAHAKELGKEKFCQKFHTSFITFAYNPQMKRAASAGDDGVRIIDVRDFRESTGDFIPPAELENGRISGLCWSPDGQILTIGTNAGNVYNFLAKMPVLNAKYGTTAAYLSSLREVTVQDVLRRSSPIDVTLKLEPSLLAVGASHVAAGMNNKVYYHRIIVNPSAQHVHEQEYVGTVREVQLNKNYAVVLTDSKATLHPIEGGPKAQERTRTFPSRDEGIWNVMIVWDAHIFSNTPSNNASHSFWDLVEYIILHHDIPFNTPSPLLISPLPLFQGSHSKITCVALTDEFLYYGTEAGTVEVFYLGEWVLLSSAEVCLDNPIKKLYPNTSGTRLVIVDSFNRVYLSNPGTNAGGGGGHTEFKDPPDNIVTALWDIKDKNVIHLYDGRFAHSYVYVFTTFKGQSEILKIGPVEISTLGEISMIPDKIEIPLGNTPILSIGGVLTCQTLAGSLNTIIHPYFDHMPETLAAFGASTSPRGRNSHDRGAQQPQNDKKSALTRFCQALALLKLDHAWQAALDLDKKHYWLALSHKSMYLLNVELAMRVYRQLGDAGMVMALQDCLHVEDRYLLAGKISLLFGDYQVAQELFLHSSRPVEALFMRKDLMHWEQALQLAHSLQPVQIPDICVHYGQQLEFHEEFDSAYRMFESALGERDEAGNTLCPEDLKGSARMGLVRCNLRLANTREGLKQANELNDVQLFADCAEILEVQKQFSEAAAMYIKGEKFEQAADIYTKHLIKLDKNKIVEAAAIMDRVQNDQINTNFAKACMTFGRYQEAVRAYQRANDIDKVVEIKMRFLDEVQQAFDLVRQGGSAHGAQLVADYCLEQSDFRGAIEFLLIGNKQEEAFKLAQTHSLVETFTSLLGDHIGNEDALKVAQYYEKGQDFGKAGKFFAICGQHTKALKLFLQCGDREIDAAIDAVGKSPEKERDRLAHQLIDFLVGEKDGIPKDPNYIYRLYMALKKYDEAAKTALIIARQEQEMGNYALAHSVLVETVQQLELNNIKVSLQLRQGFVLLHSYLRVKHLVKANDHTGAARMLLRVAQSVSKFPLHQVPILTSTVIECQRAGLKTSAYEYAVMLMRPEHRNAMDPNLKRKIEAIVRRRSQQGDEAPEDLSLCPVSNQMIPLTQLECPTTRDALPMCVITGRHMVLSDWCFCPVSKMPALYSEYTRYIEAEILALKTAAQAAAEAKMSEGKEEGKGGDNGKGLPTIYTALDPVQGKPVSMGDLKMSTPEEALAYIKKYNNVLEEKKKTPVEGGGEGGELEGLGAGGENNDENQGIVLGSEKSNQGPGGGHGSSMANMGSMVKREGSDNKLFAMGGESQSRGGNNSRLG